MPRDYIKESAWDKKNYRHFHVKLKHDEAQKLELQLKRLGIGFTEWVKMNLENHII